MSKNYKRGTFPKVWPAQLASPAGSWPAVKKQPESSLIPIIICVMIGTAALILGSFLVEPKVKAFSGLQICKPEVKAEVEAPVEAPKTAKKAAPKAAEAQTDFAAAAIAVAKSKEFVTSSKEETMKSGIDIAVRTWRELGEDDDAIASLLALYYVETRFGVEGKVCRSDTGACGHFQIVPAVWKKLFGELGDLPSQAKQLVKIRNHLKGYSPERWKAYYNLSFVGARAAVKSGVLSTYEVKNNQIESEIKALLK